MVPSLSPRMDSEEQFNLKWGEFTANLASTYGRLRESANFADVTLACEGGGRVLAHKLVLSASSLVFEEILNQNDHPKPLIYMRGVRQNLLNLLIDYVYKGEVEVQANDFEDFFALANDFKVKGLSRENQGEALKSPVTNVNASFKDNIEPKPELVSPTPSIQEKMDLVETNLEDSGSESGFVIDGEAFGASYSHEGNLDDSQSGAMHACEVCGKASTSRMGLRRHMLRYHTEQDSKVARIYDVGSSEFVCRVCGKPSTSKPGLHKHMVRYHKDAETE